MTCKDCIHYDVCSGFTPTDLDRDIFDYCREGRTDEIPDIEERCNGFKPKSRFIELPCAVGDTVYVIGNVSQEIYSLTVLGVWKIASGFQIITNQGLMLTEYYSTKEEAEKALERSEGK